MCENELEEVPISDLVVTVRQISNYPNIGASNGTENLLVQQGGVGGPYASINTGALVATALNGGPALGVGEAAPSNADPGQIFTGSIVFPQPGGGPLYNLYFDNTGQLRYMNSGIGGTFAFENDTLVWQVAPAGSAGALVPLQALTAVMLLNNAGNLALPLGTLTVARDPIQAMDVATLNWVSNNTVANFNGRIGRVQLTQTDVYNALQLDSAIATQNWSIGAINAAIGDFVSSYPLVTCWNGRTGNVYLTLSDITCVFYQPGQQPISPTPLLTSNDDSIATTKWVTEYIANEFAGGGGNLATQAWVLANTVNSFNGRMGVVTLTLADVVDVGAAPLNGPNFSGIPTAPTAAQGQATGQIATTAFVQQAIAHNTAGVSTFNTRAGDVVLTTNDVTTAGGLTNPSANLTGAPTAPTAAPGTSTPQIANTQFVMTALGNTVTSFNTRTGAIVLTTADITGAGGAPLVSPNFSSVPTAPTAAPGTNTVQLATCAFVTAALSTAGGVSSFNGRTGAVDLIGNDISAAGGLVNPSVTLTGTPTAPTAPANTNSQQIATTAFVTTALSSGTVTSFNTRTGAITLTGADIQTAGGALLAGPAFTGAPTAPTATAGTNNTQLATTQFVMAAILADTTGVTSFNTRTGAVSLTAADITGAGGALSASPQFTGIPQAPTATAGTNTTQLATTQFVQSAIASSGVSSFNARTGAVTLIANDISAAGGALLASPVFTGTPAAPTAAPGDNSTTLATTAFVAAALTAQGGPFLPLAGGTVSGVVNMPAGSIAAPAMVFGAVATQKGFYATGAALGVAISGASVALFNAGGLSMAQPVTLPANATTALQAVPLQQLQLYVPLAGGNMTGSLTANQMTANGFNVAGVTGFALNTTGGNPTLNFAAGQYIQYVAGQGLYITCGGTIYMSGGGGTAALSGSGFQINVAQISGAVFPGSGTGIAMQPPSDNTFSVGTSSQAWFQVASHAFPNPSDPRIKKAMADAPPGALDKVMAIAVKCFLRLGEDDDAPLHTGFDAAQVQDVMGDAPVVWVGDDEQHTLSLNLPELIAWLWQGVQELTGRLQTAEAIIADMRS